VIRWSHLPVRRWLRAEYDRYPSDHPQPWVVRNGMFIVARCSKQSEAEGIVRDVELAFARAIARDILNEETSDMTDLKKLIENAGKKFADDVVAAIMAAQVGDLLDEAMAHAQAVAVDKLSEPDVPTTRREGKVTKAKPPRTKAQAREGQVVYWCKRASDERATAIMPDASARSFGRSRDLVYRLRKEGYTVVPLVDIADLTAAQKETFLVAL
jgi:hypothetical protein